MDSHLISIWPAGENHIDDGARAVLLRAKSPINHRRLPSLCLYLLDELTDPIASLMDVAPPTNPLSVRRQDVRPGWGIHWNDELTQDNDETFRTDFQSFQADCSTITNVKNGTSEGEEKKSEYHASNELSAHCRTKPIGH